MSQNHDRWIRRRIKDEELTMTLHQRSSGLIGIGPRVDLGLVVLRHARFDSFNHGFKN